MTARKGESREEYLARTSNRNRAYYQANKERIKVYHRERRKHKPDRVRDGVLGARYGITASDYDTLFAAQGGVCRICKQPETTPERRRPGTVRRLAVDHCHRSDKVRGLLCANCNKAIGCFQDSPERCLRAADYLQEMPPSTQYS